MSYEQVEMDPIKVQDSLFPDQVSAVPLFRSGEAPSIPDTTRHPLGSITVTNSVDEVLQPHLTGWSAVKPARHRGGESPRLDSDDTSSREASHD